MWPLYYCHITIVSSIRVLNGVGDTCLLITPPRVWGHCVTVLTFSASWTSRWCHVSGMAYRFTAFSILDLQFAQANNKENTQAQCYWPFVRGIHRWPVDSPHNWPVMWKVFPWHDVTWTALAITIWWIMSYLKRASQPLSHPRIYVQWFFWCRMI